MQRASLITRTMLCQGMYLPNHKKELPQTDRYTHERWRRAAHAASRLQTGDGLFSSPIAALPSSQVDECDPTKLTDKELTARKATFWGSLSLGVGKKRDEEKELPFHSKELETQHW